MVTVTDVNFTVSLFRTTFLSHYVAIKRLELSFVFFFKFLRSRWASRRRPSGASCRKDRASSRDS